jgi:hypothetical protein
VIGLGILRETMISVSIYKAMCFANLWLFPKAQSGKSYDLKPYD